MKEQKDGLRNVEQFKKGMEDHSEFFEMIKQDKELFLFFSRDKIKVWCDGLSLWSLYPNTRGATYQNYYDTVNARKIKNKQSKTYRDERKNQQKIAHRLLQQNNLSAYPVCVEFTIPFEFTKKGKKPEIDFLVLDAENKTIYLVEYKCSYNTSVGSTSIEEHYKDFACILQNKDLVENISKSAKEMYEFYTDFYHAKKVENLAIEKILPAFLFTDFSIRDKSEKCNLKKMLKAISAKDKAVVVWNFDSHQNVDFSKKPFPIEDFINSGYPLNQ